MNETIGVSTIKKLFGWLPHINQHPHIPDKKYTSAARSGATSKS
jgi:hypothetical protein